MKRDSPPGHAGLPLGAGTRRCIDVPSSGPLFKGHFPGRPILPGVALLDLALRALAPGTSPALREIGNLRLRRLVAPGDVLELDVQAFEPDGRARLEVRRGSEVVANCVVSLGEPLSETSVAARDREPRRSSGAMDLDDLLPHRPPMRFVEGITAETEGGVVCAVRVPKQSAFNSGGFVPALVAIEMAAQSAAVCEALRRLREAEHAGARVGYLVGARDVRFARARVPAGERLFAAVELSGIALPLCTYAFEVALENVICASGTVSTWLTAADA